MTTKVNLSLQITSSEPVKMQTQNPNNENRLEFNLLSALTSYQPESQAVVSTGPRRKGCATNINIVYFVDQLTKGKLV